MILIASQALVTITMGLISYFSTLISHGQVMMSVRVILLALLSLSPPTPDAPGDRHHNVMYYYRD